MQNSETKILSQVFEEFSPIVDGRLIDDQKPLFTVAPRNVREVSEIVKVAHSQGLGLAIAGSRTAMRLGKVMKLPFAVLDTANLNSIVEYVPEDLTITVEAGMTLATLQFTLAEHGQYLPINPPPSDEISVGGMLVTGIAGTWRGQLPSTRDLILGATTVKGNGTVVRSGGRVVKNVTGYDLHRLHAGSLGSFGVVAETTFKVLPLPTSSVILKIKPKSIKTGIDLGKLLLDKGFPVRSVVLTSPSVGALLLSDEDFLLLVDVGGSEVAVAQTVAAIRDLSEFAVDSIETTIGQQLRSIFKGDNRIVIRVGVPRQRITEIMSYMMEINIAGFANIAAGQILGECFSGDLNSLDELAGELGTLREIVERYHGYLLIENAPTDLRSKIDPSGRAELSVVGELRRKFDPGQIINPGRMGGRE
jgi:glycolate oxidase FAD binding subunit